MVKVLAANESREHELRSTRALKRVRVVLANGGNFEVFGAFDGASVNKVLIKTLFRDSPGSVKPTAIVYLTFTIIE